MHELSVAEAIISAVLQERDQRRLSSIAVVGVSVGVLSGVLPDALQFCFEAAVSGTPLAETALKIDQIPATGQCEVCRRTFDIEDLIFRCPKCDSDQVEVLSGWELDIAYLEVDTGLTRDSHVEVSP